MTVSLPPLCLVDHSSCADWGTIINIAGLDAIFTITCVNHTTASDTKRYVIYMTVSCIEDQVAGSRLRYADLSSDTGLGTGSTR